MREIWTYNRKFFKNKSPESITALKEIVDDCTRRMDNFKLSTPSGDLRYKWQFTIWNRIVNKVVINVNLNSYRILITILVYIFPSIGHLQTFNFCNKRSIYRKLSILLYYLFLTVKPEHYDYWTYIVCVKYVYRILCDAT